MKPTTPNTFQARLRHMRKCKHLTQSGLAAAIGCTQVTVSLWETGVHYPKLKSKHLSDLAECFGTTPEYMLTGCERA